MIRVYSPHQHIDQTYQEIHDLLKKNEELTGDQEELLKKKIRNYHLITNDFRKNSETLTKSEIIIRQKLPTIDFLKKFIIEIKPFYLNASGNQGTFVRLIRKFNPLYHQLFNILIGISFPIDKMITYSYWDLLVIKLILSWCIINGKQIQIRILYQIVDQVNGDKPWTPPRSDSLKNKNQAPKLTRTTAVNNLKSK